MRMSDFGSVTLREMIWMLNVLLMMVMVNLMKLRLMWEWLHMMFRTLVLSLRLQEILFIIIFFFFVQV